MKRYALMFLVFFITLVVFSFVRELTAVGSPVRFIGSAAVVGAGFYVMMYFYQKKT
jgi:lipopolysaccharide export LptBFGC system permease protein LptF